MPRIVAEQFPAGIITSTDMMIAEDIIYQEKGVTNNNTTLEVALFYVVENCPFHIFIKVDNNFLANFLR
jgi:hypothetical protein